MKETILYNVDDAKVYPITAIGDGSTAPTYGSPVDVPAFQTIGLDPEFVEAALKGDGKTVDQRSVLDRLSSSIEYGKIDLEVLPVIAGGTVTTGTGVGDTDHSRYVRKAGDKMPEFGLAARISEVDNPGAHAIIAIFRCKVNGGTLFSAEQDDYGTPSFDVNAIGLPDDGSMFAIDLDGSPTTASLPTTGAAFLALRTALP